MDRQQKIAIILVVVLIGSTIILGGIAGLGAL
jgi:hypothetical protein